jgi:hypothetical protein
MDQTDEETRVFPDPAKVARTSIFSDVVNLDGAVRVRTWFRKSGYAGKRIEQGRGSS